MATPTEHVESSETDPDPRQPAPLELDPGGLTDPGNDPGRPAAPETTKDTSDQDLDPDPDEDEDQPSEPRVRETPEDLVLEAAANSVALHPSRDVLVLGDVDGDVYAFSYSCTEGQNQELWSSGHHLKSCRQVRFSEDGLRLYSVSRDKAVHLLDVERGCLLTRIRGAHAAPINSLLLVDQNVLATGDDGGTLKVFICG